jgi:hypothetical protein
MANRQVNLDIKLSNGQQAGKTINELKQQANRLNKEVNNLKPGTEEFIKKSGDLKKVGDRLGEVRKEAKGVQEANNGILATFQQFIPFNGQLAAMKGNILNVAGSFKTLRGALIATGLGALVVILGSLITYFSKFQEGIDFVSITMQGLGAVVNELLGRIGRLGKGLLEILNGNFAKGADILAGSFDNLGESIKEAFNEGRDIERARIQLERFVRTQEVAAAQLQKYAETNKAIADDATRSFKEREDAAKRARAADADRSKIVLDLARQELDLVNREVALRNKQGTALGDLAQKQADAQTKVIEAEKESMLVFLDNEKVRRELVQDRLERDLDILIDGFDNYKTINEKIIESDKLTFDERSKKLEELTKLSTDSFNKQVETIQEFTGKSVDAYDLLNTADAEQLNNKIRNLGLSEIIEGRLLEVIRERRIVIADFAEFERNIMEERAQQELDAMNNLQDLRIASMQEGIDKEIEQIWLDTERKIEALTGSEEQIIEQQRLLEEIRLQKLQEVRDKYAAEKAAKDKADKDAELKRQEENIAAKKAMLEAELSNTSQALGAMAGIFGGLASMQAQGTAQYKAFAIAQASIAATQSAINAYSSTAAIPVVGPALAPIAAGIALAAGLANVARIKSQKIESPTIEMEKGGLLQGPRHSQGGIPAIVGGRQPIEMEGGEFVFSRKATAGIGADVLAGINRKFEFGGPVNPIDNQKSLGKLPINKNYYAGGWQIANEAQGGAGPFYFRNDAILNEISKRDNQMANEFRAFREEVSAWQRNLRINNNLQEVKEGLGTLQKLENDASV